jgi:hypothetical protein
MNPTCPKGKNQREKIMDPLPANLLLEPEAFTIVVGMQARPCRVPTGQAQETSRSCAEEQSDKTWRYGVTENTGVFSGRTLTCTDGEAGTSWTKGVFALGPERDSANKPWDQDLAQCLVVARLALSWVKLLTRWIEMGRGGEPLPEGLVSLPKKIFAFANIFPRPNNGSGQGAGGNSAGNGSGTRKASGQAKHPRSKPQAKKRSMDQGEPSQLRGPLDPVTRSSTDPSAHTGRSPAASVATEPQRASPWRLSDEQIDHLEALMVSSAAEHGWGEEHWTPGRVADLIHREYGILVTPDQARKNFKWRRH